MFRTAYLVHCRKKGVASVLFMLSDYPELLQNLRNVKPASQCVTLLGWQQITIWHSLSFSAVSSQCPAEP